MIQVFIIHTESQHPKFDANYIGKLPASELPVLMELFESNADNLSIEGHMGPLYVQWTEWRMMSKRWQDEEYHRLSLLIWVNEDGPEDE